MAQYTAKDLKNVSKAELVDLLKKEGIEFDPTMPYFTLRSLLINKDENKNEDSMKKENTKKETAAKNIEQPVEQVESVETEQLVETKIEEPEVKSETVSEEPKKEEKKEVQVQVQTNKLSTLRGELIRRKGGKGLGTSAFAAELAKRKGERVSGVTFAQELKSRQLKYGNK